MVTRREFLDTLAIGAAGLAVTSSAKSYGRILGSNDRVNFAILGLHIRGYDHLWALIAKNSDTAHVAYNCDVDRDIVRPSQESRNRSWAMLLKAFKTFVKFFKTGRWMPSPSPLPTTGTPLWRFVPWRRASTSMLKSHVPTILPRQ